MENDQMQSLRGYEISTFEAIASKKGLTINYHRPEDNEWGKIKKSGNESAWSGMIGEVAYKRADVCLSAITIYWCW